MLESVVSLSDVVNNCLKRIGKLELVLDADDLHALKDLIDFLIPFRELTELFSDNYNSMGMLPLFKVKIKHLCKVSESDTRGVKQLKVKIKSAIEKRFKLSNTVKLAAILDPAARSIIPREEAITLLLEQQYDISEPTQLCNEESNDVANMPKRLRLIKELQGNGSTAELFADEIDRYMRHVPNEDELIHAPLYWKHHEDSYPRLKQLAKQYLAIPSSSVSVEAMFSTTGLMLNARRSSLDPFTMNMDIYIHDNIKHIE